MTKPLSNQESVELERILRRKLPEEWQDLNLVIENGAAKHGKNSWVSRDNPSLQHSANTSSMFRHLAEHYAGVDADNDSGLDPLLHLACRALMKYSRKKRMIDG